MNEPSRHKINVLSKTIRTLMRRPFIIGMATIATLFTSVFSPGFYLGSEPFALRLALNSAYLVLYCACTYAFLGRALAHGLQLGFSWFATQTVFYLPLAAISTAMYFVMVGEQPTVLSVPLVLVAVMTIVVFTVLLALLAFQNQIDLLLGELGYRGQTFRRRATPKQSKTVGHDLDGIPGRVLRLRGANQYVDVETPEGQHLIRMRLRDAATRMPVETGFQINRSVWLAWEHIADISTTGSKVVVTDRSGETYNVSPSRAAEFQALAALNSNS